MELKTILVAEYIPSPTVKKEYDSTHSLYPFDNSFSIVLSPNTNLNDSIKISSLKKIINNEITKTNNLIIAIPTEAKSLILSLFSNCPLYFVLQVQSHPTLLDLCPDLPYVSANIFYVIDKRTLQTD